ncbi:hypothetical protein ACHAP5_006211 [Fusarium lateritium]
MSFFDGWLAVRKDRDTGHWTLMLSKEGSDQATCYHSTGGPAKGKSYKVDISTNRLPNHGVEWHPFVGKVLEKDKNKVMSAVQSSPARFCQSRILDALADLEKRSLVPEGTWEHWNGAAEVDPISDDFDLFRLWLALDGTK